MSGAASICFHCGEPVAPGCALGVDADGRVQPVCCTGCQAVAKLILQSGQSRYYRFRTATAMTPTAEDAGTEEAWRCFDERQSLWGNPLRDGRHALLLQVEGIRCAACAWLIRRQLEARRGVSGVQVDVATGFVRIDWRPDQLRLSKIAGLLSAIGYRPHLPLAAAEALGRQQERRDSLKRLGVAGLGMMQVMMYAVGLYAGDATGMTAGSERFLQWVSLLVTTPVVLYSGRAFYRGAWHSLRALRVGMDVPVALAITIAFALSAYNFLRGSGHVYFDSVVMFVFFLLLGRHAELAIRHRNLQSGLALARLLPEWAERLEGGGVSRVPAQDLRKGDRVRVRVGQVVPADGRLSAGCTEVDEALLTGESRGVEKRAGDAVVAGSINRSQPVEVLVERDPDASTVSVIGRMLLKAQMNRSPASQVAERYAGRFVAAVLALAVLTAAWWSLRDPEMVLPAALAVLVISCPCALSLATPAALAAAGRALLERGVLLTRGPALEDLGRVDTVVFDKTGTLTRGAPSLAGSVLNPERGDLSEAQALRIGALLEADSAHPVARAFADFRPPQGAAEGVRTHASGVEGRVGPYRYRLGNAGFSGVSPQLAEDAPGQLWLSDERGWIARFELDDGLRHAAAETVSALRGQGLETIMLSGDHSRAVAAVAQRVGIQSWRAAQDPEMKMEFLQSLQAGGKTVLMVGDGVNDAPVLAAASVSMTVSGASELANSTADFILTGPSLGGVGQVFEMASRTRAVIRQNLGWALGYNILAVPFAAAGLVAPWMAALGMSLSSLLVVLNSGRLAARKGHGRAAFEGEVVPR